MNELKHEEISITLAACRTNNAQPRVNITSKINTLSYGIEWNNESTNQRLTAKSNETPKQTQRLTTYKLTSWWKNVEPRTTELKKQKEHSMFRSEARKRNDHGLMNMAIKIVSCLEVSTRQNTNLWQITLISSLVACAPNSNGTHTHTDPSHIAYWVTSKELDSSFWNCQSPILITKSHNQYWW